MRDLYLYHNHGLEHAAIYLGVTVLACVGYGAFFLVAGMLFRNPILPAAAILIWEGINPFLPAVLKQFSVIYYLKSLCPVDIPSSTGHAAGAGLVDFQLRSRLGSGRGAGHPGRRPDRALCVEHSGSAHGN